jgi:hypothetical protein
MNLFIVSPLTANGVTYLLNIFLELNILIYRTSPEEGPLGRTWSRRGRQYKMRDQEYNDLINWLPSLANKWYTFDSQPRVCWDHPASVGVFPGYRQLVFCRDPRDALFSWWRRTARDSGVSFSEWLDMPNKNFVRLWPSLRSILAAGDTMFFDYWEENFSRIKERGSGNQIDEMMASYEIYLRDWVRCGPTSVVRFEDVKSAPMPNLINILNSMNAERDASEITKAIANSSTIAAAARNELTSGKKTVIFRGLPFEWRGNDAERRAYDHIQSKMKSLITVLGYEL